MAKRTRAPATPDPESGRRLRELRLAKRMTQRELAGERYSVSYISAIERGQARPSLGVLQWSAQRLGIPVQELFPPSPGTGVPSGQSGQRMAQALYEQLQVKLAASAGRHAQARTLLTRQREQMDDAAAAAPELVWYAAFVRAAMGDGAAGRSEAERFARLADERANERWRASAQLLLGLLHANAHEPDRAIEALRAALALANSAPVDLDFTVAATSTLALALAERGSAREAHDALDQAVETFERFADPARRVADAERLAERAAADNDYVCACSFALWAWVSQRILNAERTGARLHLVRALLAGDGAVTERERDLLRAHELTKEAGDEPKSGVAAAYLVAMLAEAGEAERARQAAERLDLARLDEVGNTPAFARAVLALAHGWLAHLDSDGVRAAVYATASQEALDAAHEAAQPELASAYAGLGELYFALGDMQHASVTLRRAVSLGRRPYAL